MIIPPNLTSDEKNRRLKRIKRLIVALLKNKQKNPPKRAKKEIV